MQTRVPRGAHALFGALGGSGDAYDREMDRLSKMELSQSQIGFNNARADATAREIALKESIAGRADQRRDPSVIEQGLRWRMPDADPAGITAFVKRAQNGPWAAPNLTPDQQRLAAETAGGMFMSAFETGPTQGDNLADIMFKAGSSAQRLRAPEVLATDPNKAAFLADLGAGKGAPSLYAPLPGGLGMGGTFTGQMNINQPLQQSVVAENNAKANASNASAENSRASAGKSRVETEKLGTIWDTDRGGLVDWRTGTMQPVTSGGAPIGPKAQAGAKPHFDAVRGIMVNPDGTATPVTVNGQPVGGKPLSPADQARIDKRNRAAGAAKASLDNGMAELDRLAESAREVIGHPGLEGITGKMGMLPNIPGSDRANAAAKLETLKSQAAFRVLQAMRDMSKTGGALGAVSDKENEMLQNNLAALNRAQSYEEFKRELGKIVDFADSVKRRMQIAYDGEFGAADAPPSLPRPGEIVDGYQFKGGDPGDPAAWEAIQ